jgi:hypothetical protein
MHLSPEDLTIFKNTSGDVSSALGFPINSCLLQQNMPLMFGGGGSSKNKTNKKTKNMIHDYISHAEGLSDKHLAVPAGLFCMQVTMRADDMLADHIDMPEQADIDMPADDMPEQDDMPADRPVVSDDLYEQLLLLATGHAKPVAKKLTKRAKAAPANKHKTRKYKK